MISQIHHQSGLSSLSRPQSAGSSAPAGPADGRGASVETSSLPSRQDLAAMQASVASEAKSLESKLGAHVEGQVLVKLKAGENGLMDVDGFANEYGASTLHKFNLPKLFKNADGELVQLKLPAGMSTAEAMAVMAKDDRVAYVEPNHTFTLDGAQPKEGVNLPDDLDTRLWGLNNTGQNSGTADADIDAPEAWTVSTGARADAGGPIIAVIDTGADFNHPDLKDNIWTNAGEIPGDGIDNDGNGVIDDVHGYNALANSGNPMDGHSHGSHCSGTIGASGNNAQGVVGVNWQATIMPVKIFSDQGSTDAASIIRGINYATQMGARITSNSWGGGQFNQGIYDAFKNSPALHIMAAGNSGSDNDSSPHYPSSYDLPNNVAVAATDRNDQLASFSCYGANSVDIAAPGVNIWSTVPVSKGSYGDMSGTSMATPHVSGVAGLIAAAYPNATNDEIKARLMNGSDKLSQLDGKVVSGGRLNAANALDNDQVAPAAPNDLRAISARANGATLQWTATGDDGWCGQAGSYELRVSDRPIVDGEAAEGQVSFSNAELVATAKPSATGTLEQASFSVVPSGQERTKYYALKVRDNVGNASEMRTGSVNLPPAQLAFEDNMDGGAENFIPADSWAQVDAEGRGKVWTDSPGGNYADRANTSLTTRPISLQQFQGSTLIFDTKFDLERRYDNVYVEGSTDGQSWERLAGFTGSSDWSSRSVDISKYDGQDVQLRFRLNSDSSQTADGFYLDNMVIAGDKSSEQK